MSCVKNEKKFYIILMTEYHNIEYDYINQKIIESLPTTICLVDLLPKTVLLNGFGHFIENWISNVNTKYPNENLKLVQNIKNN